MAAGASPADVQAESPPMSGLERLQARANARRGQVGRRALAIIALCGFLALGMALELTTRGQALAIDGQPEAVSPR